MKCDLHEWKKKELWDSTAAAAAAIFCTDDVIDDD